jgi:hypothetical protein
MAAKVDNDPFIMMMVLQVGSQMIRLIFLVTLFAFCVLPQTPSTTDWRGLAPLKSSRKDVEQTLGRPDKNDDHQMTYYLPEVTVFVYFSGNPKCEKKLPSSSWNVKSDIVTAIDVSLRQPVLVVDTGFDLTKFKKIDGSSDMVGRYYYLNSDGSFSIEVGDKYATDYHYRPGSNNEKLRCDRQ